MAFTKISAAQCEDLGERGGSYELDGYVPTGNIDQGGCEGACVSHISMAERAEAWDITSINSSYAGQVG